MILRSGQKSKLGNHRPISLTSPGKLLERLARNEGFDPRSRNNLISTNQHGFIKGRSCTTNLLEFLEDVTKKI